jgi:arabinofuranosyltransferase
VSGWGHRLPEDTWVAVYANGALPYYSRLPTIDVLGLTDEHIARQGLRKRQGIPGHIAHDYRYVVGRRPAVVVLSGEGLSPSRAASAAPAEFAREYVPVAFRFASSRNDLGSYVSVLLLRSRRAELVERLARVPGVQLVGPADERG